MSESLGGKRWPEPVDHLARNRFLASSKHQPRSPTRLVLLRWPRERSRSTWQAQNANAPPSPRPLNGPLVKQFSGRFPQPENRPTFGGRSREMKGFRTCCIEGVGGRGETGVLTAEFEWRLRRIPSRSGSETGPTEEPVSEPTVGPISEYGALPTSRSTERIHSIPGDSGRPKVGCSCRSKDSRTQVLPLTSLVE
jgi:hypothetical protein